MIGSQQAKGQKTQIKKLLGVFTRFLDRMEAKTYPTHVVVPTTQNYHYFFYVAP